MPVVKKIPAALSGEFEYEELLRVAPINVFHRFE